MPRVARSLPCTQDERNNLKKIVNSGSSEYRLVQRAKIILQCIDGNSNKDVALNLGVKGHTVAKWRQRFFEKGIDGLQDKKRKGRPEKYGAEARTMVLKTLEQSVPAGQSTWDGVSLAKVTDIDKNAVWRILKKEGIQLQRYRSWCVSKDKDFAAKAADVIGLYLNPPANAIVFSVDEKPNIQALKRARGFAKTSSGKIVNGLQSTYKRNGTINLFSALETVTGAIKTKMTKQKRRVDFLAFMDEVIADVPTDKEIHIILDNLNTHKNNDAWLLAHPKVFFHYTPTSASWLNMVEIFFGILTRKVLKGASFESVEQLQNSIEEFLSSYRKTAKPFIWRKREVHGAQLRNNAMNFCN